MLTLINVQKKSIVLILRSLSNVVVRPPIHFQLHLTKYFHLLRKISESQARGFGICSEDAQLVAVQLVKVILKFCCLVPFKHCENADPLSAFAYFP